MKSIREHIKNAYIAASQFNEISYEEAAQEFEVLMFEYECLIREDERYKITQQLEIIPAIPYNMGWGSVLHVIPKENAIKAVKES